MFLASLKSNHALQAIVIPAALGAFYWCISVTGKRVFNDCIMSRMYSRISICSSEEKTYKAVFNLIQAINQTKPNQLAVSESAVDAAASSDGSSSSTTMESEQLLLLLPSSSFLESAATGSSSSSSDYNYNYMCDYNSIVYSPAMDNNTIVFLKFRGRIICVYTEFIETTTTASKFGHGSGIIKKGTMNLYALGRDPSIIKSLIHEAIDKAALNNASLLSSGGFVRVLMRRKEYPYNWACVCRQRQRPISSVMLDASLSSSIIDDARSFLSSKDWYDEMSIPFRRGYLLYGPPGCGKTSFCRALAGALQLDISILPLSDSCLDDSTITSIIREAPKRSIILLEDIDAVFSKGRRNDTDDNSSSCVMAITKTHVSFAGLLNAIDGVDAQEGRIVIMTTNHIDRLDPSLIRPGRCDFKVMFRNASRAQLHDMFLRIFPGHPEEAHRFADSLPEWKLSLAQVQGHLVQNRKSVERALDTEAFLSQIFSSSGGGG